jgi:hypothetical protein
MRIVSFRRNRRSGTAACEQEPPFMQPRSRAARLVLAAALCGLAGRADADGGLLDGLNSFKDFFNPQKPDEQQGAPAQPGGHHLFCPEVIILEGTAASQVHAGNPPTNMNLRYQYALGDVVRQCELQGDQLAVKIGIAGNVLLGPAGAPASFSVPLRVAIIGTKDNHPILTKLYHVAATIPAGQAGADFSLVTEPLLVPFTQDHTEDDYTIKVGIDEGPEKAEKPEKAAKQKQ